MTSTQPSTVLVTGASSGFGEAITRRFAAAAPGSSPPPGARTGSMTWPPTWARTCCRSRWTYGTGPRWPKSSATSRASSQRLTCW